MALTSPAQRKSLAPMVAALCVAAFPAVALAEVNWLAKAIENAEETERPRDWAYSVKTTSRTMDEPRQTSTLFYDPSQPEETQWSGGPDTTGDIDLSVSLSEIVDPPIYADLADLDATGAELQNETETQAVYKFSANPGEPFIFGGIDLDIDIDGADFAEKMIGLVTVEKSGPDGKAYISDVSVRQAEAVGSGLAKFRKLSVGFGFVPMTAGLGAPVQYVPDHFEFEIDMRLFFLLNIAVESASLYDNYKYVGPKPSEQEL